MADDSLDVIYRILTDLTGLKKGVDDVTKHTAQIDKQMNSMLSSVKTIGGALGIAFSAGAVVTFAKSILADADALTKMSDKTGISVEALQRLRAVADESGNSLESITAAIGQMQNRLAGDNKSAVAALKELHLNLAELRSLSPEDQFAAIAKAIAAIPDPMQRTHLAMALFGKSGAEILPTLRADIDKITKSAVVLDEESTKALDSAGDSLQKTWRIFEVGAAKALVAAQRFAGDYITQVINPTAAATQHLIDKQTELQRLLPKAPASPGGLTASPIGVPIPRAADIRALEDASKKHLEAVIQADKHAESLKKIDAEYRQYTNMLGERRLEAEAAALAKLRTETEMYLGMLRSMRTELLLVSTNLPQMFMGLADGTRQVLEPMRTWRTTLHEVSDALQIVGDRWASVAVGMIRNLEAVVALWQTGFKAQAIGQAIGALGQLIPESDRASVSAAKMATQFAAVGSVFGPLGTGIGAAVGAVVGWIKAGQDAKKANHLRDAFQDTFGSLEKMDEAFRKVGLSVKTVLNAKSVKEFQQAVEAFNKALQFQKDSYERLMQAVERYKFSLEELGPALARQKLEEQAQQIYEDFMLLVGAGLSTEAVTKKMADAINAMVRQYLTLGMEVPPALRPILQHLIDMGLLLDQNGDAITDISQIDFAETMSEGFDRVVDAIDRMTDAIDRFLGITRDAADAVRNFPTLPDMQVPGIPPPGQGPDVPMPPDMASGLSIAASHLAVRRSSYGSDPTVKDLLIRLPDMMKMAVRVAVAEGLA